MTDSGRLVADRYRLDELVGDGRVCLTWRATDMMLGRTVAVRLPRPAARDQAGALAEFRAAAQVAGSLAHENVARVYDYDERDGDRPQPYLVMEYVHGPSLARVLADGRMDLPRALDLLSQVAAGLDALHGKGLVHGDLRPAHVLLGSDGSAKLTGIRPPGPLQAGAGELPAGPRQASEDDIAADLRSLGELARQCLPEAVPLGVSVLVGQLAATSAPSQIGSARLVARLAAALRPGMRAAVRPTAGLAGLLAGDASPEHATRPFPVIGRSRRGLVLGLASAAAVAALAGVSVAGLGWSHPATRPGLPAGDLGGARATKPPHQHRTSLAWQGAPAGPGQPVRPSPSPTASASPSPSPSPSASSTPPASPSPSESPSPPASSTPQASPSPPATSTPAASPSPPASPGPPAAGIE